MNVKKNCWPNSIQEWRNICGQPKFRVDVLALDPTSTTKENFQITLLAQIKVALRAKSR